MYADLSVYENVRYSALLFNRRLYAPGAPPTSSPESHFQAIVSESLDVLGLSHVAASLVGDELRRGISLGQRKRVSIAMEVVKQPRLLLLDEPTSGLDASTSLELAEMLKRIATARVPGRRRSRRSGPSSARVRDLPSVRHRGSPYLLALPGSQGGRDERRLRARPGLARELRR